jgi:hypothetical protein
MELSATSVTSGIYGISETADVECSAAVVVVINVNVAGGAESIVEVTPASGDTIICSSTEHVVVVAAAAAAPDDDAEVRGGE